MSSNESNTEEGFIMDKRAAVLVGVATEDECEKQAMADFQRGAAAPPTRCHSITHFQT